MFWLSYTMWLAILLVRHFKHISINLIVAFWCVIILKNLFLLSNRSFNIPPSLDVSLPTRSHHWFSISMRSRLLRILNASRARSSYRRASRRKPGYLSSPRAGLWLQLPWHLSICPFVLGVLSQYFAECEVSQRPLAHSCRNVYTWLCCSPLNWITPVYSSYATVISHTQTFILFFFDKWKLFHSSHEWKTVSVLSPCLRTDQCFMKLLTRI